MMKNDKRFKEINHIVKWLNLFASIVTKDYPLKGVY